MSSSSQEEIAVNLPMIRKMERICRFLSQIQKKLSQIQTFFCHRFKHFFQHRSNHALDIHFLLLLLYDWPNLANKKSGECRDFWPSRSFEVFCFLNKQWSEKLEIICRLYFLPSDQFVSFHFHFLNRKVFHVLVKEYLVSSQASLLPLATLNQNDQKKVLQSEDLLFEGRRCPKFTFSTYTPDPNLHKSQIYTGPKFTQTQIYTGPIFTQQRFTQIHFRT